ncbi:MAG: carboxypeptidase regulatory-like domain-containing protein [Gemmatimonadaceae bacterium]
MRLGAILILLCAASRPAVAQGTPTGTLEGVVMDSARVRPLGGAVVRAFGIEPRPDFSAATTTGGRGEFRIDSLPPGRYVAGFESPLLDSLEITLSPREVAITAGRTTRVDFAFPSGSKLREAACPGPALPKESGAVLGRVLDPDTELPLAGVVVAVAWQELAIDRATLRAESRERTGMDTTDARGWYRMCGVPTDTWLLLQLQHAGRAGAVIRILVNDTLGIARHNLSFSAQATQPRGVPDSTRTGDGETTPLTGTALLSGVVRGLGDGPLGGADVGVRGARSSARSNATGRYELAGLPAGTQVLEVRHLGYLIAEEPVELRSGRTVARDVRLKRIVNLDSVLIVARRSRYGEFEQHRKQGFGTFLGIDDIERRHASMTSDLIRMMPGLRVVGFGLEAQVISGRGASLSGPCKVNIVIDGISYQDINLVNPGDIGAIAVYRQGQPAPMMYDRGCGAIVIWTKR